MQISINFRKTFFGGNAGYSALAFCSGFPEFYRCSPANPWTYGSLRPDIALQHLLFIFLYIFYIIRRPLLSSRREIIEVREPRH